MFEVIVYDWNMKVIFCFTDIKVTSPEEAITVCRERHNFPDVYHKIEITYWK